MTANAQTYSHKNKCMNECAVVSLLAIKDGRMRCFETSKRNESSACETCNCKTIVETNKNNMKKKLTRYWDCCRMIKQQKKKHWTFGKIVIFVFIRVWNDCVTLFQFNSVINLIILLHIYRYWKRNCEKDREIRLNINKYYIVWISQTECESKP